MNHALVVDDDPDFRSIVQVILEQAGYHVEEARDGQEALDKLPAMRPDFMLVGVNMPVMGGIELCRRVRALDASRDVPFLLITACAQIDVLKDALAAGATDYILKPFGPDDLLSRVARALAKYKGA